MAGPAVRDLELYRGDDYSHVLTFVDDSEPPEPLDLSEYTFKAQIRDRPSGSTALRATFDIDVSQAAEGIIVLSLPSSASEINSGYWDLEVHDGEITQTWLLGSVTVDGDVTKTVIS